MPLQVWHGRDAGALLELARCSALVEPAQPALGLRDLRIDQQPISETRLLQIELNRADATRKSVEPRGADANPDSTLVDYYVRSGDLIATYPESPEPAMRSQVYWRAASHDARGAIAAIEVVASVQTSLLESCPKLGMRSELIASEAFQLADPERGTFNNLVTPGRGTDAEERNAVLPCYLFRLPGMKYSYAEMVHPAGAHESEWDGWLAGGDFRMQLRHQLFADRLEKGVILRTRVLGLIVDRLDDKAATARHYAAFLSEELPLTT